MALPGSRTTRRAIRSASCARWARRRARAPRSTSCRTARIFSVTEYNYDTLANRLRQLAFLNKGIEITLTDERATDAKTGEAKTQTFKYTGGIAEFIKLLNKGKQVLHEKPIYMEAERDGVAMEIALQYNDAYSETVFSLRE